MKILLRALTLVLSFSFVGAAYCNGAATDGLVVAPDHLENGAPFLITVALKDEAVEVSGSWMGKKVAFFSGRGGRRWYALAGVDVEVAPGRYPLDVEADLKDGSQQRLHRDLAVEVAPYAEVTLQVPDRFIKPDPKALREIAADKIVKDKAFAKTAPRPEWTGEFVPPLPLAPRSDSFGTRRVFNGTLASVHRGLDYRAKNGTPVAAVNAGQVVLAQPLYFEGGCVVIDHGLGLMTVYMHLSKIQVAVGDGVSGGQRIALSGGTGRATGPHLHLGVRWQGSYLDPVKLFQLALPSTR